MIDTGITPQSTVVFLTNLKDGETWISGTFEEFVTPGRAHLADSVILVPTDRRALSEKHHRGAVQSQMVYAVPESLILGELDKFASLRILLSSPDHALREAHVHQILESLGEIADNFVVTL
jgi:hypothetical protein